VFEEVDEVTKLKKGVLAILNKLCPQKFDILVEKFTALPITNQNHLQECMELIFEKAVDEPGFSVAYARMCQVLQRKKVLAEDSETETVNFRKLLISRCQKEFDKDYMESLDRDKYRADMAAAQTDDERKQIKAVFEQT
jgi:translation initiation factor 4G